MRVTIVTGGSRGDIQPFVALGRGLVGAGHQVKVAAYAPFEDFVRSRGLEYARLSGDPGRVVRRLQERRLNQVSFAIGLRRGIGPFVEDNVEECLEACRGSDVVVYTALGFIGSLVAQKLGISGVGAALQPLFTSTCEFPSFTAPEVEFLSRRLQRSYNRLTFFSAEQVFWQIFRPLTNRVTRKLGLPRAPQISGPVRQARRRREPLLYGWSPTVLPRPRDWDPWVRITGYWFLDRPEVWRPPAHLEDFLQSGPPPVCVGFGSMRLSDPGRTTEAILSALRAVGKRGLLVSGWADVGNTDLPDDVLKIEEAPHDWLLPKVSAFVHHGGSGTTGAALRAGRPSIVVPFIADQAFWGRRVERLGAGTTLVGEKGLSPRTLTEALRHVLREEATGGRAARLGQNIRAEDGVARAVAMLEGYVNARRRASLSSNDPDVHFRSS